MHCELRRRELCHEHFHILPIGETEILKHLHLGDSLGVVGEKSNPRIGTCKYNHKTVDVGMRVEASTQFKSLRKEANLPQPILENITCTQGSPLQTQGCFADSHPHRNAFHSCKEVVLCKYTLLPSFLSGKEPPLDSSLTTYLCTDDSDALAEIVFNSFVSGI